MTNLTMPKNNSSMKYALKFVPGLADVWGLHEDGDEDSPGLQRPVGKTSMTRRSV